MTDSECGHGKVPGKNRTTISTHTERHTNTHQNTHFYCAYEVTKTIIFFYLYTYHFDKPSQLLMYKD